jgi:hypothetical protein
MAFVNENGAWLTICLQELDRQEDMSLAINAFTNAFTALTESV